MVTSSRIVNLELIVSPSGTILIPIVGVLDVKGKTIDYVYDAIIKKCKERYEDAYVYVELIKTRNFKVLITGDFIHSGMFPVSSVDRVSDLIESIPMVDSTLNKHFPDLSKNILLNKDIYLIRKDSLIDIDLFKYYIGADFSSFTEPNCFAFACSRGHARRTSAVAGWPWSVTSAGSRQHRPPCCPF